MADGSLFWIYANIEDTDQTKQSAATENVELYLQFCI